MSHEDDPQVREIEELRPVIQERIHPLLAGRDPGVQGGVLADLLATWVAGHPPQAREELLDMHLGMVRQLVKLHAKEIAQRQGLTDWE